MSQLGVRRTGDCHLPKLLDGRRESLESLARVFARHFPIIVWIKTNCHEYKIEIAHDIHSFDPDLPGPEQGTG